ncbi:UNVERIFIED_CONTAM: hypothetical protein FKN15_074064 [Acipenser sinensis]
MFLSQHRAQQLYSCCKNLEQLHYINMSLVNSILSTNSTKPKNQAPVYLMTSIWILWLQIHRHVVKYINEKFATGVFYWKTATASTSIKKWITRTPHSPSLQTPSSPNLGTPGSADQRTPSPRNVLSPIALSPMPAPPASERRVKRRLETSGGGALGCPGDCDCVMELDPSAKKRRGLRGLYCLAEEEQQKEQGPSPGHTEQEAQQHLEEGQQIPSPGHLGKENSSPGQADWLSAMGQRLKREQGSPSSLRSPSAKKQGSRTTGSPVKHLLILQN